MYTHRNWQSKMPSATSIAAKKFFLNKRFYLHVRRRVNTQQAAELIRIFGGQIDEFLETSVSYVLTDVPKNEWPPAGNDDILKRARSQNVKLMSLHDLTIWCSKYLSSQSSSDEDDDSKVQVTELREPYIKFEDANGYYAPVAKEIPNWPELCKLLEPNLPTITSNVCVMKNGLVSITPPTTNTRPPKNVIRGVKRRHSIYCEICNLKLSGKLDEHIESQPHKTNINRMNWSEVHSVIQSIPSFASLSKMRKGPNESIRINYNHEFLCLHKVESVSQLFMNTASKEFHSSSPQIDRQLVQIQ